MKFILTDVEGTTTSISFVHDVLFPFAKERLASFVQENSGKKEIKEILSGTSVEELLHWIDIDKKEPALKNLQGHIWEEGYVLGQIKGHVYSDVLPALKKWKEAGIGLGVYSSGSVKAQHLIFEFSTAGNLRPYFSHHFDTGVGHKRETQSYVNIADKLQFPPQDILFLSDIKEELDAARKAGMKTIQLVRQDDVVVGDHKTVRNFSEI